MYKKRGYLDPYSFFFLSSVDLLEETTWSSFHFELDKILLALAISDERIMTKQTSDLDWSLWRDSLATVLVKILFTLTTSDERILIKQASDLDWSLSRDLLTTVLVKILFTLTTSDERIFIKSNPNSAFVWSNCEQSTNLDVFSLKRRLLNLKNCHRQKTRLFLFDLQNRVDREF
jgi:hypothetical protein